MLNRLFDLTQKNNGKRLLSRPRLRRAALRACAGALAIASAFSLTGCGSGERQESDYVEKANVTFSWWGNDPRHQYTLSGLKLFQEKNSDVTVSPLYGIWDGYERRYQIMMLSHSEADVMQVNYAWLAKYSPYGTGYYDLSQLSDVIDFDNYSEEDLKTGTVYGKLIALPIAYNTTVLFFNKDLYDSYGLDIPSSWEDLEKAAEVMRDDGIYPIGMVAKHLFLMLVADYEQKTGKTLFDVDGSYIGDVEATSWILSLYKKMVDEKVLPPANEFDTGSFPSKKTGAVSCWVSDGGLYCNSLIEEGVNIEIGDRLYSENEVCSGWYMKPATMYAISREAANPEAAGRLLNFLVNDPDMALLQGTEKGVPVSKTALETLQAENKIDTIQYNASKIFRENQADLQMMIPSLENSDIQTAFIECSDKYIYDVADLDAASKELNDRFTELTSQE